jgi:large repetitive protein
VGTKSSLVLLSNLGDDSFVEPQALRIAGVPVLGDVDQDGDLDVAANGQLLLNDGSGAFEIGPAISGCVTLADVDGDGDLDCLANVGYGEDQQLFGHVLFNDGTGAYSAGDDTPFGFECEVADLDGDGDLDAVCVSPVVEGARSFFNDGHGVFTRSEQLLGEVGARAFALGDLDSDGDIDLVLTQWLGGGKTAPNVVLLNDGTGYFEHFGSLGSDGGDIELADLDGDGDLDALLSHLTPYGPIVPPFNPSQIYLNDHQAHFTLSQHSVGDPAFNWFELADLDGDGDLDAFVYNQLGATGNYSGVWFNEE